MSEKRLYRTEGPYKMLCGVCGGIAEYFDIAHGYPLHWLLGLCGLRHHHT